MGIPIVSPALLAAAQSFDEEGNFIGRIQPRTGTYADLLTASLLAGEEYTVLEPSTTPSDIVKASRNLERYMGDGTNKLFIGQTPKYVKTAASFTLGGAALDGTTARHLGDGASTSSADHLTMFCELGKLYRITGTAEISFSSSLDPQIAFLCFGSDTDTDPTTTYRSGIIGQSELNFGGITQAAGTISSYDNAANRTLYNALNNAVQLIWGPAVEGTLPTTLGTGTFTWDFTFKGDGSVNSMYFGTSAENTDDIIISFSSMIQRIA